MAYEVLARKWRPQQFGDVVGQEHVARTLRNAITSKRIAHAYLFVGPRGVGKTSIARIFAKALNCKTGPTVTPCDQCDACREISAGNNFDVIEIDGASNTGVDQVRDLRDSVKYMPGRGPFKIYIIDEVHMLSTAAFNALLKTLEEPPEYVKFLFATTEPDKILATILSRCQRFDLRRIPVKLIVERLALIARDEKVQIEPDALLAIARGAEGGLRDAESAMDQLISFTGQKITEEDVLAIFGLVGRQSLEELSGSLLAGDVKAVVRGVAHLDESGKDLQRLLADLMAHFRNLIVYAHAGEATDVTEAQLDILKKQAAQVSVDRLMRIMDILGEAEDRVRFSLSKRTLLETALIRCARAVTVVTLEELLAKVHALRESEMPEPVPGAQKKSPDAVREVRAPVAVSGPTGVPSVNQAPARDPLATLRQDWHDVVDRAGRITPVLRSLLLDAMPIQMQGDHLVVGIDEEFASEMEELQALRNRRVVEHVIGTILKQKVSVGFQLLPSDGVAKAEVQEKGKVAGAPSATEGAAEAGGSGRASREWLREPAVRKVLESFDGVLVEVRE